MWEKNVCRQLLYIQGYTVGRSVIVDLLNVTLI